MVFNRIAITNIYYPGYSAKHKHSQISFLNDLEELYGNELICYDNIIVGDINIHTEKLEDAATKKLYEILIAFDLHLHITDPTHKQGGVIDILISSKSIINKIDNIDVLNHIEISDHYPIQFSVSTQFVPVKKTVCIKSH